jgi:hypothetical protein
MATYNGSGSASTRMTDSSDAYVAVAIPGVVIAMQDLLVVYVKPWYLAVLK